MAKGTSGAQRSKRPLKQGRRIAESGDVAASSTFTSPSVRARALSTELNDLIRLRRAQDPELDAADAVTALELSKLSLLSESGATHTRFRAAAVAVAALLCLLAGVLLSIGSQ